MCSEGHQVWRQDVSLLKSTLLIFMFLHAELISVKAKLLERRVFFVGFVRVYLQLVVIFYSFLLLYCQSVLSVSVFYSFYRSRTAHSF